MFNSFPKISDDFRVKDEVPQAGEKSAVETAPVSTPNDSVEQEDNFLSSLNSQLESLTQEEKVYQQEPEVMESQVAETQQAPTKQLKPISRRGKQEDEEPEVLSVQEEEKQEEPKRERLTLTGVSQEEPDREPLTEVSQEVVAETGGKKSNWIQWLLSKLGLAVSDEAMAKAAEVTKTELYGYRFIITPGHVGVVLVTLALLWATFSFVSFFMFFAPTDNVLFVLGILFVIVILRGAYDTYMNSQTNKVPEEEEEKYKALLAGKFKDDKKHQKLVKRLRFRQNSEERRFYATGLRTVAYDKNWNSYLTEDEFIAIMLHEVAHLRHWDTIFGRVFGYNLSLFVMLGNIVVFVYNWTFRFIPILGLVLGVLVNLTVRFINGTVILANIVFFISSTRQEYSADGYAVRAGMGEHFISGLKKIADADMSVSVWERLTYTFTTTHPPTPMRIISAEKLMIRLGEIQSNEDLKPVEAEELF